LFRFMRDGTKAVAFVPDFGDAYDVLAMAYDQKGMPGEARYARGMKAYSQGRLDAAAKELEAAGTASPAFAPAFAGLGLVREKQGKKDAAAIAFETAMSIDAANFNARSGLARLGKLTVETSAGAATGAGAPNDTTHQAVPAPPADANHQGLAPADAQKAAQP
jgi:tetratricopeptide (TPR) repeat protein